LKTPLSGQGQPHKNFSLEFISMHVCFLLQGIYLRHIQTKASKESNQGAI
jgi:hypothetical protein